MLKEAWLLKELILKTCGPMPNLAYPNLPDALRKKLIRTRGVLVNNYNLRNQTIFIKYWAPCNHKIFSSYRAEEAAKQWNRFDRRPSAIIHRINRGRVKQLDLWWNVTAYLIFITWNVNFSRWEHFPVFLLEFCERVFRVPCSAF